MKIKKLVSMVLAVLMLVSIIPSNAVIASENSEIKTLENTKKSTNFDGYVEISTKEDLNAVRYDLSGKYVLTADIVFSKDDFSKDGAYYNNGMGWIPIGTSEYSPFSGVFDGNGHTISGLTINGVPKEYTGLFGCVEAAIIKDLGVVNLQIDVNFEDDFIIGGIVGYAFGQTTLIENCYANGRIYANRNLTDYKNDDNDNWEHYSVIVGGLVGNAENVIMTNCYSESELSVTSYSCASYPWFVDPVWILGGGLIGRAIDSCIINCKNYGEIIFDLVSAWSEVAGIVGIADYSTVINSHNDADIYIKVSESVGDIDCASTSSAAGICAVGESSSIIGCYNNGNINSSAGRIDASLSGGIYAGTYESCWEMNIINCFNSGSVTTIGFPDLEDEYYIYSYPVFLYSGGISALLCGNIKNCYNIGKVSASNIEVGYDAVEYYATTFVSGIVYDENQDGYLVENCYYLYDDSLGFGELYPGVPCIEDEMIDQNTYVGFDFQNTWMMSDNTDYSYPKLKTEVVNKELINMSIMALPNKLSYRRDTDNLDISGGKLVLAYNCGDVEIIDMQLSMISEFDNTTVGAKELTVSYMGFSTSFEITVFAKNFFPSKAPTPSNEPIVGEGPKVITADMLTAGITDGQADWQPHGIFKTWHAYEVTLSADGAVYTAPTNGHENFSIFFNYSYPEKLDNKYYPTLSTVRHPIFAVKFKVNETAKTFIDGLAKNGYVRFLHSTDSQTTQSYHTSNLNLSLKNAVVGEWNYAIVDLSTQAAYGQSLDSLDNIMRLEYKPLGDQGPLPEGAELTIAYMGVFSDIESAKSPSFTSYPNVPISIFTSPQTHYYYGEDIDLSLGELLLCDDGEPLGKIKLSNTNVKVRGYDKWRMGEQVLTVSYEGRTSEYTVYVDYPRDAFNDSSFEFFGSGTDDDPYMISRPEHLYAVNMHLDSSFVLVNDIDFNYRSFGDEEEGFKWSPIGSISAPFTGNFDGNGKIIKNLKVNYGSSTTAYVGLFGYINGGTIKNLGMVDSEINVDSSVAYVGGIVGYVNSGEITGCYNVGNVSSLYCAGGIVGYLNDGKIADCYNAGSISSRCAGGISGYMSGGMTTNCYNVGNTSSSIFAGGIVGYVIGESVINNSYYLDNVSKDVGSGTDTAVKCTAGQMKLQSTFVGFDFNVLWTMGGNADYPFPELQNVQMQFTKELVSIAVTTNPTKTEYLESKDTLDVTDGKLTIKYSNLPYEVVDLTLDMITGFDNTAVGKQTLTVTYEGKTDTFDIEIIAKSLVSIAVTTEPTKTKYLEAKDTLDVTGGKVTLYYNNDTSDEIDLTLAMVSGFDNTVVGEQTLTVTYEGKTDTFDIEIIAKSLVSIAVTTEPTKTEYLEAKDTLDVTGGKVTLYYNNDTSDEIDLTLGMITGFDNTAVGEQTLTVTYEGKTATFDIEIIAKSLVSIAVTTKPSKTEYRQAVDTLDVTGGKVTLYYNNDTSEEIDLEAPMVSGFNNTVLGKQTLTVTYGGKSTSFDIEIIIAYILGDLNGDEIVTDADAIHLLYHTFLPDMYEVDQSCDFNKDGTVTDADAIYLLYFTFLPDLYPID